MRFSISGKGPSVSTRAFKRDKTEDEAFTGLARSLCVDHNTVESGLWHSQTGDETGRGDRLRLT